MALQPPFRNALQLMRVLCDNFGPAPEHKSHAGPFASVDRIAQVGTLLSLQAEVRRLQHRLGTDRDECQAQRSIGSGLIDLIESRYPVLPVAVGHELARGPVQNFRGADRIAQCEG